jgi:hypothetical protein
MTFGGHSSRAADDAGVVLPRFGLSGDQADRNDDVVDRLSSREISHWKGVNLGSGSSATGAHKLLNRS